MVRERFKGIGIALKFPGSFHTFDFGEGFGPGSDGLPGRMDGYVVNNHGDRWNVP